MISITKESILSIISEQVGSMEIDEMPNRPIDKETGEKVEHESWSNPIKLPEPVVFNLSQVRDKPIFKIASLNPDVLTRDREEDTKFRSASEDEMVNDVAICHSYKVNKFDNRKKLYIFKNYAYNISKPIIGQDRIKRYKHQENYVYVNDAEPNVPITIFPNNPRNKFFSTPWAGPQTPKTSESYSKRYLHFERINELFNRQDIRRHLIKCLIPPIEAYSNFDIPVTMKIKDQHHYTAPNYNFVLSGLWLDENVQSFIDKNLDFKMAIAMGDEPPEPVSLQHMPRDPKAQFVYRRGSWSQGQKVEKKEAERTDILKLLKKSRTGGKSNIVIVSNLLIQGRLDGSDMTMSANFSVFAKNTPTNDEDETITIRPINPILATIRVPVPDGIRIERLAKIDGEVETSIGLQAGAKNSNEYKFLSQVYDDLMNNLGEKIMEIDSDTALDKYATFDPADVEREIYENNSTAKVKIIITEDQLNTLLKGVHAKPKIMVTEAQLKEYMAQK